MGAAGTSTGTTSVENVFSTFLYTGNGGTKQITNNLDLSGEGGLTWIKFRNPSGDGITGEHHLFDTVRGATKRLRSNSAAAEQAQSTSLTSFNSDGFSLGAFDQVNSGYNSRQTYVSWSFRKAPKFFDIVKYTGNGSAQSISHNLGSVPGMILTKVLNDTTGWAVYHRGNTSEPETERLILELNVATNDDNSYWNDTAPTSTHFTVGSTIRTNSEGKDIIAYLFAHNNNDGGFGPTEDQDIIKCGSYTGNGNATGPVINLGFEAQWVFIKNTTSNENWQIMDSMRNLANDSGYNGLIPNLDVEEQTSTSQDWVTATSTGFKIGHTSSEINENNSNFIYMAIRFPNMEEITDATKVFDISAGTATNQTPFPVDMFIRGHTAGGGDNEILTRLLGNTQLDTNKTTAEAAVGYDAFGSNTSAGGSGWGTAYVFWNWKRAKGYFDVVCWDGTGSGAQTVSHSLGVAPELVFMKPRAGDADNPWQILYKNGSQGRRNNLPGTDGGSNETITLGATSFSTTIYANSSNTTFVGYLFATLAGVSKVGIIAHSGSSTDVDCGFSAGARFVLLKRDDASGDWYIWDSARGIIAGNDPYLLLNDPAAQVTNTDYIDPLASGFQISGDFTDGTYLFYAIA